MPFSKIIFSVALLALFLTSCIKRYDPEIKSSDAKKLVVTGQVIKGTTIQQINISQTAAVSEPQYKYYVPVTGCRVNIVDSNGNSYYASDKRNGNYESSIPANKLIEGASFKVQIFTPEGENIVSDFDMLMDCPDIDSVYYRVEQLPTTNPSTAINGIRFYCNLDAKNFSCRNFRWEAVETWEYKAIFASSSDRKVCWITAMIHDIFTLSTINLSENVYNNFALHFVDNYSSQRLLYGYSLLIKQYSMSAAASDYWGKIRNNYADQGGLYSKQPIQIVGNMHNLTNPDKKVLGFFGASTLKQKRIFVGKIYGLAMEFQDCEKDPDTKPPPYCYDCLFDGGTNVKPGFWPN